MTADRPPPVDLDVLHALTADLGHDATAGMIDRFLAMLEDRITRIRTVGSITNRLKLAGIPTRRSTLDTPLISTIRRLARLP
ncbi:MAG: hypothetical protein ACTHXO_13390 [Actinomycetaceae bacterium]